MKHVYHIKCNGIENIPKDENYILVGNHLNILDSWLLIAITDEHLRFMVDKKLYKTKLGKWFFKKVGTFEIDPNETDVSKKQEALKKAFELLKSGEKVVIFPEGKTHPINVRLPFMGRVSALSKMSKTVLIPFGLNGTYKPFTKLEINIGEPIDFSKIKLPKSEENQYLYDIVRSLEPFNFEELDNHIEIKKLLLEENTKKRK
jgi:1-acyl-sn-glycerol-3-phosphate acyltransferase